MPRELTRILTVDDEAFIRDLLEDFLTFLGYEVATAENGAAGLARFEQWAPHFVILDVKMPGLSGLDVLREIKTRSPETGAIILSAFGDSQTIQEAQQQGADYYLQKPVDLNRLKEMLNTWKGAPAGEAKDERR